MSETLLDHMKRVRAEARQLFTLAEVDAAIARMARELEADYRDRNPLCLVLLNGGVVFAGRLLPLMDFPLQQDYLHATRYLGETHGGELQWRVTPTEDLRGRHVLILDDVLDEGSTLTAVVQACEQQGAASVKSAVLIDKRHERKSVPGLRADYTGLEAEDAYLFGGGMDYRDYWRNAPGIFAVPDEILRERSS
jgi:hypoxanthine phosphoribosyltransferase